ncbi:MAG: hypothetical protein GY724_05945 [Actinomycetia bacterium]|nr:hypothetical protein [Actinomycetes bacterium]MCP5031372.1 hypothetical protein [Actinomycetes bacterium]
MHTISSAATVRGIIRSAAVAVAFLLVVVMTVTRSEAAFTATTANSANSWAAGTVVLTDDDSGSVMFNISGMAPNDSNAVCLAVTYSGSVLPADVLMYGSTTGTLDDYLDTTIEIGTGGSFASCAGFTPSSTLYNNTLTNFATTHSSYATGLATFTAASNPTTQVIRITVSLQDNDSAQGLSSTADFTFEVQE